MQMQKFWAATLALLLLNGFAVAQKQPASSTAREQFEQYVADLRKNPSDDALREKVIKLALTLDPKPPIPDEAAVAAAKGKTIFLHVADSGSKDDLKAAADAFAQASLLAPWVPDYYYNQGLALEKADEFDDAIRVLSFYLIAAPGAPDANDTRGKIEAIKYEKDKVAKQEQQQEAEAWTKQQQFADNLAGKWKTEVSNGDYEIWSLTVVDRGAPLPRVRINWTGFHSAMEGSFSLNRSVELLGTISAHNINGTFNRSFRIPVICPGDYQHDGTFSGTISQDGRRIEIKETGRLLEVNGNKCQWVQGEVDVVFDRY